jgi:cysteinyl-tRNA synthetase
VAAAFHAVESALLDDLNTPMAIAALSEPLKAMNELLFSKKGRKVCIHTYVRLIMVESCFAW